MNSTIAMIVFAFTFVLASPIHADPVDEAMAILETLNQEHLTVRYEDHPLGDVLAELSRRLPIPVRGDWDSMIRLGVDDRDTVTIEVRDGSAATVLSAITLALGDEFDRPVWEVHAGQVVLTSLEGTAAMRLTDAYDVRDLLARDAMLDQLQDRVPPPIDSIPAGDQPDQEVREAEGEERPGGAGFDDDLNLEGEMPDDFSPGESLMRLILEHVDSEGWVGYGGDRIRFSDRSGVVLVTATPTTHRRFQEALTRLRSRNPSTVHVDIAIVHASGDALRRTERRFADGTAGQARGLLTDSDATVIWQSRVLIAPGESAALITASEPSEVQLTIRPDFDHSRGTLRMTLSVVADHDGELRRLETAIGMVGRQPGAILELPATTAGPSAERMWVVLAVR